MAGKTDQVEGQAKEAVGSLVGNKDLEAEGKAERRSGEVKEKVGHAMDKVHEAIDKVKDALHHG
ncbi:MAG: CsbD family protein [Acidimicrobiales bacterium]